MARILLVDDDDAVRTMLHRTLARLGHAVIEARNGLEALKLFPEANADLLIMDVMMPEKDGIEVLMELQKYRTNLKIIMMSGGIRGNSMDFLAVTKHLGATRILKKPFSNETLLSHINELMAESQTLSDSMNTP